MAVTSVACSRSHVKITFHIRSLYADVQQIHQDAKSVPLNQTKVALLDTVLVGKDSFLFYKSVSIVLDSLEICVVVIVPLCQAPILSGSFFMFKVISPNRLLLASVCCNMHVFENWFQGCSSSTRNSPRPVLSTDHRDMTKTHLHAIVECY